MEKVTLHFFYLYLLFPLIALITGITVYLFNKKHRLFTTKKLVLMLLLSTFTLGLPGLAGLVDYWFMPYIYIILGTIYLLLGGYNLILIKRTFYEIKAKEYGYEFALFVIQIILGAGLFSLLFNLCNELKYGLWACTCILPFIFISLYAQAYHSFINIPLEIYKVWQYSYEKRGNTLFITKNEKIVRIEMFKKTEDKAHSWLEAAYRDDLIFGEWFQYCIENNNMEHPSKSIDCCENDDNIGWIFYIKPSFFLPRRYIDPDLTIKRNRIKRVHTIIARRVRKET